MDVHVLENGMGMDETVDEKVYWNLKRSKTGNWYFMQLLATSSSLDNGFLSHCIMELNKQVLLNRYRFSNNISGIIVVLANLSFWIRITMVELYSTYAHAL